MVTELKAAVALNRVGITFTLGKGSFCYGATLERTTDTLNPNAFVEIGNIEGVCGDQFKPVSYTLWDNAPIKNRQVWYRIITGYVPTNYLTVEVPYFYKNNHSISPNPMYDKAEIQLPANTNGAIRVEIYNPSGSLMRNEIIGYGDKARLSRRNLEAGLHIYKIFIDDELHSSGKLMLR